MRAVIASRGNIAEKSHLEQEHLDNFISVWPPDMAACLYSQLSNPDMKLPWNDQLQLDAFFRTSPSFAFGRMTYLPYLRDMVSIYEWLADAEVEDVQKRAESAIQFAVHEDRSLDLTKLPLGVAAPVHEAARSCQLSPPGDWTVAGYNMIGRNDLAASATRKPDMLVNDGYRAPKDFIVSGTCPEEVLADA